MALKGFKEAMEIGIPDIIDMYKRPKSDNFVLEFVESYKNNLIHTNETFSNLLNYITTLSDKKIKTLEYAANSHEDVGDFIIIYTDETKSYIEIKYLTTDGSGTLANIGPEWVKNYNLCKGIISFNDFNKKISWFDYVRSKLLEYDCSFEVGTKKELKDSAEELKENSNLGDEFASKIKAEISEMSKIRKIEYLSYLSSLQLDEENLRKFTIDMLEGRHSRKQRQKSDKAIPIYINYKKNSIVISNKKIDDEFVSGLHIVYDKNLTNFKINNINNETVLTVCLHWKNVFQGIATPCFNIFKG